jgi:O-antigen ligase/polysaccharide polymerase Wzy-like membrane protein
MLTVVAAGSILDWMGPARKLRWAALVALAALAVVYAVRGRARLPVAAFIAASVFLALAVVSAAWSATERLTLGRALGFTLVLVAAAAMALGASARRGRAVERLLHGVLAAAVVVALGGLLVLAFRYDRAVQPASTVSPARYQGLGGGPNMVPMVLAVAAPIAAQLASASARPLRFVGAGALALLLGSIAFSGSRGGLVSAFAGLFAFALAAPSSVRRRALLAGGVGALLIVTVAVGQIPSPSQTNRSGPTGVDPAPAEVTPRPGFVDANLLGPRLQDEVGHPGVGVADTRRRVRSLLGSSGRTEAWVGVFQQAVKRPLLGHAFGTEDRVFVDRYVFFNSGVPENSYLGLFLQLGVVGLAAFALLAAALLGPALRSLRMLDAPTRSVAAAAAAAFVAGLVLALFQSYVYAPGNNATIALWICGFLALAAATAPRVEAR